MSDNCRHGELEATCYLCKVLKIEELEAENKALREVYKHAKGLCMGVDWNNGTAAQHHRDGLEDAVEEVALLNQRGSE